MQGGFPGQGNISDDPEFLDLAGPDGDPNTWDDADLRLRPESPCIDSGSNALVPSDTLDLDGDGDMGEPVPVDGHCRFRYVDYALVGDSGVGAAPIVDRGALEYQACPGDVNGDDVVDIGDLSALLSAYDHCDGDPEYNRFADFDSSGCVDLADLAIVTGNYGGSCDDSCY